MRHKFISIIPVLFILGCSSSEIPSYLLESTKRCDSWSSLNCSGLFTEEDIIQLLKDREGSVEIHGQKKPIANLEDFTPSVTLKDHFDEKDIKNFDRLKYLNGWGEDVSLDSPIPFLKNNKNRIWVASGGFLPEEFDKQEIKYTFAEEDCAAQIRDGVDNGAKCQNYYWFFKDVGVFLKFNPQIRTLEEFIKLNNLSSDTKKESKLVNNRYYKVSEG